MQFRIALVVLVFVSTCGCSPHQTASSHHVSDDFGDGWPKDWSALLGQTVTLEGTAADAKCGAMLVGETGMIWIDGLDGWPVGFYDGGTQGKRLRVTGTVIERDDLPVFVQKPGEAVPAGIAVHSEAELQKAKWRFLLKDARWTVVE